MIRMTMNQPLQEVKLAIHPFDVMVLAQKKKNTIPLIISAKFLCDAQATKVIMCFIMRLSNSVFFQFLIQFY